MIAWWVATILAFSAFVLGLDFGARVAEHFILKDIDKLLFDLQSRRVSR